MKNGSYQLNESKIIIRIRDRVSDTPEELLSSEIFRVVFKQYLDKLSKKRSRLLGIFEKTTVSEQDIDLLIETMKYLTKLSGDLVPNVIPGSEQFFRDPNLFNDFIEQFYNHWRQLHRLVVCDSLDNRLDKRPYRTFNDTVEKLVHVVRSAYRDIQENITGNHPNTYRQVSAGAEIGAITLPVELDYPTDLYKKLNEISIIRQVLIYPPMIFDSPMNKRKGMFQRVYTNPLENVNVDPKNWLCYPAKVGPLVIMVYFHVNFFELGFSLSNLFELADDEDLKRKPDAIYLYGTPESALPEYKASETIFYDDEENDILVGTIPLRDEFGYFGYLKKMILTLHNIIMMKRGRMPFHGAFVNLTLLDKGTYSVLIMGESGAGKSETLEALRVIGRDELQDSLIIADDMGSLTVDENGLVLGFGTEIGAFVRLDDLQPGYAFGQIDRAIIMNASQVNARVVLPVTKFGELIKGYPVDFVLYANNFEEVIGDKPIIQAFNDPESAREVFRSGAAMSKGTTATTGLVHTYFANIFGPPQYEATHERISKQFFEAFFKQGSFVGQMRTQLGVPGMEFDGPRQAAIALLEVIKSMPDRV